MIQEFGDTFEEVLGTEVVEKTFEVSIAEDNNGCISEAYNPVNSELSKHIDSRYKLLVDNVHKGMVQLHYVQNDMMVADLLTKNLVRAKFWQLLELANLSK